MALSQGTRVGPYEVLAQLGAGGMGEVYRAADPRLGRDVAVKVIRRLLLGDDTALDRLLREATLASSLNHPNIVTIYETGVVDDDRYIAMELVEGSTLRAVAAQGLPLSRAIAIAKQIAEALAVAHAAQIIHRDIKPDNVMVRPDGYVKLLDFGLARAQLDPIGAASTGPVTGPGLVLGTIAYMAPEQARGENVGPEADVFALGVLLYELVTGRHPFMAASQLGTLHALMSDNPEPPAIVNPELPRTIEQLILEALQKDPRLRPGASEVMYRLNVAHDSSVAAALSSVTVSPRRPVSTGKVVGRESELEKLFAEFGRATRGQGRLVVVSAEAGLGKTTLVETFLRQLEESGEPVRVGRGRCSERLAGSEAYLPVLEVLDSLQHNEQLGSLSRTMRVVAPSWYAQIMPPSRNDSSAARLAAETLGGSQERLKFEMAALLEELGRLQPVVLWFDDVHWADPSTTDLLGYIAHRLGAMRVMILATSRPSELAQSRHPFLPLKLDLIARGKSREIIPRLLDEGAIERYVASQFPEHAFPSGFAALILRRTEGNPLFMTDLLRDLRRRQVLRQQDGRWIVAEDLAALERELPQSVRSLIQRKMDALSDSDRRLLSAAAIQGIDFDSAIVASALQLDDEAVETALDRLEREHALVRFVDEAESASHEVTLRYRFAHYVYHQAFAESVRATRRVALSRAIAERLVARNCDVCDCAADIALLFESARDGLRAAEYFNKAAQAAARLYAHEDTARLAEHGLALLAQEPDTPARAAAELDLQMTYGLAIKTSQGYAVPAVGKAYARARELCRRVNDPRRVIPVLIGMSAHHIVSGDVTTAYDIALEMRTLFERIGDPHLQMIGEWSLGATLFHMGELENSHAHLLRGLELYDPAFHNPRVWQIGINPGVFCRCELSRTLTLWGFPGEGLRCVQQAVAEARALEHPQVLAFALLFEIFVHVARRDATQVLSKYEELAGICVPRGIAQELQWAAPFRDRALIEMGHVDRGLAQMVESLKTHTITRSTLLRPYYFLLYAGSLFRARRYNEAQRALDEAVRVARDTNQHAYDAEHARLQAEVFIATGQADAGERTYNDALTISRERGARWLELRATRGYAKYLAGTGRTTEARTLLEPLFASLPDAKDTLDFVSAEALLKTLMLN
jgi:serine/threonine protein kinase/tetratricopeptide (TPR) repeat protein